MVSFTENLAVLQNGPYRFLEREMFDEVFEIGTKPIGPIRGQLCAGNVDSFFFRIRPNQLGKSKEILLERVDVEIAVCMVGIAKNCQLPVCG
jgi:hypothetical protein